MFKLPETTLAALREGNPSRLTADEAREVARYIDTLATLVDVPVLLGKVRDDLGALKREIRTTAERREQDLRMQRRNQRMA